MSFQTMKAAAAAIRDLGPATANARVEAWAQQMGRQMIGATGGAVALARPAVVLPTTWTGTLKNSLMEMGSRLAGTVALQIFFTTGFNKFRLVQRVTLSSEKSLSVILTLLEQHLPAWMYRLLQFSVTAAGLVTLVFSVPSFKLWGITTAITNMVMSVLASIVGVRLADYIAPMSDKEQLCHWLDRVVWFPNDDTERRTRPFLPLELHGPIIVHVTSQVELDQLRAEVHAAALVYDLDPHAQQVREYEPSVECVVCRHSQTNVLLLPCRHMCMCQTCFDQLKQIALDRQETCLCPLCRQTVVASVIIQRDLLLAPPADTNELEAPQLVPAQAHLAAPVDEQAEAGPPLLRIDQLLEAQADLLQLRPMIMNPPMHLIEQQVHAHEQSQFQMQGAELPVEAAAAVDGDEAKQEFIHQDESKQTSDTDRRRSPSTLRITELRIAYTEQQILGMVQQRSQTLGLQPARAPTALVIADNCIICAKSKPNVCFVPCACVFTCRNCTSNLIIEPSRPLICECKSQVEEGISLTPLTLYEASKGEEVDEIYRNLALEFLPQDPQQKRPLWLPTCKFCKRSDPNIAFAPCGCILACRGCTIRCISDSLLTAFKCQCDTVVMACISYNFDFTR